MNHERIRSAIFALLLVGVLWWTYRDRVYLEAWLWHLRHGTSASIGSYVVPVPSNWYVVDRGETDLLLVRLDTNDQTRVRKFKSHAVVSVFSGTTPRNLEQWVSIETSFGKLGHEQRAFNFSGDRISCVGGAKLSTPGLLDIDPDTWTCLSTGGLNVIIAAVNPDMQQVWDIVSGIRKKS